MRPGDTGLLQQGHIGVAESNTLSPHASDLRYGHFSNQLGLVFLTAFSRQVTALQHHLKTGTAVNPQMLLGFGGSQESFSTL